MLYIELLKSLDKLNLSSEPYAEAEGIIEELCQYYNLIVPLPLKTVIIRARCNEENQHFNSKCELTYPPKSIRTRCSRAALPNEQMFYACTFENRDIPKSLIAVAFETNYAFKENNRITYGYWRVKKEIELIVILPNKNLLKLSHAATILKDKFISTISKIKRVELRDSTIAIANYFSNYFSKKVNDGDEYEYIISAEFTKYLIKRGFDGILYPSVRIDGEVLNIALSPEVADTKLELEGIREFNLSQNNLHLESYANLYQGQTHFQLLTYLGSNFYDK